MPKRNQLHWTNEAVAAFEQLKKAMSQTPVMALPDFTIMQEVRPIAYLSKAIPARKRGYSTMRGSYRPYSMLWK